MAEADKYIAVGDVHGCAASLEALVDKMDPAELARRQIVFVGDYIDRGPDSKGVVDFLLSFREDHDCVFLRGNHEQMLLEGIRMGNFANWMLNGGGETLDSYGDAPGVEDIPDAHMDFFEATRLFYDTPDYFFVHAGLPPGLTIREAVEDEEHHSDLLWERSHLAAPETAWEKTVVFGHTPRTRPLRRANMIGIDTGCVFASRGMGTLTAVLLPEEEFIQQPSID
ncbi:MAG: metallophosphoesterase family protein [Balneolaceae bacterium]|nr:metallophosphoesterase family protein [Balneolaceae bacterium]